MIHYATSLRMPPISTTATRSFISAINSCFIVRVVIASIVIIHLRGNIDFEDWPSSLKAFELPITNR